jgi:tRNA(Leu) C34 or U34 (ribose-2'-O)-methylase TrmL
MLVRERMRLVANYFEWDVMGVCFMNKYDNAFASDMSSKQVTALYFRLIDEVRYDEKAKKELDDAHMKAWDRATKKEHERFDQALKEGYSYTKSCECFTVSCKSCGYSSVSHGSPIPNCYLFFGKEHEIA